MTGNQMQGTMTNTMNVSWNWSAASGPLPISLHRRRLLIPRIRRKARAANALNKLERCVLAMMV